MGAGGIDTFAAAISKTGCYSRAGKIKQPARHISADEITITTGRGPTRYQSQTNRIFRKPPYRTRRFLKIQKAKIVFSTFTDDYVRLFFCSDREKFIQLIIYLALKVSRVRGNPNGGSIAFCPKARWSQIAQSLANARTCFCKHNVWSSSILTRLECSRACTRVVRLLRSHFGTVAQHHRQTLPRLICSNRLGPRLSFRWFLLPNREAAPNFKTTTGYLSIGDTSLRDCMRNCW